MTRTYREINLQNIKLWRRGKVRDIFDLGENMLMVASDRVSAFDVVLPNAIPFKGQVLNSISAFWFENTKDVIKNHIISTDVREYDLDLSDEEVEMLRGRSSLVRKGEMVEVECVVRGYLDGSGWASYRETGKLFDITLPKGLKQGDRLPEPLFTPTTKATSGHDEYMGFEQVTRRIGADVASFLRDKSIELYNRAHMEVYDKGLILADTKFEFTYIDGEICLADEIFTPDSSRYWDRESYKPGGPQPSFDKQYIRDWLQNQDWDKTPPAPELPDKVVEHSVKKYLEVYRRVTGKDLAVSV
jgi:phosphoribosylaminoimidazole-succinocarboxamide synthase